MGTDTRHKSRSELATSTWLVYPVAACNRWMPSGQPALPETAPKQTEHKVRPCPASQAPTRHMPDTQSPALVGSGRTCPCALMQANESAQGRRAPCAAMDAERDPGVPWSGLFGSLILKTSFSENTSATSQLSSLERKSLTCPRDFQTSYTSATLRFLGPRRIITLSPTANGAPASQETSG